MKSLLTKNLLIGFLALSYFLPVSLYSQSWTKHSAGLIPGTVLCLNSESLNLLAGTYGEGVFKSSDNGNNWTKIKYNLPQTWVKDIITIDTNYYAGTGGYGVFRISKNTNTWVPLNTGLSNRYVQCFGTIGNWLYAGTRYGGVFRTTNNGASWTSVSNGLPNNADVRSLVTRTNMMFAATSYGIYYTLDSGATWTEIDSALTNKNVTVLHSRSGTFYAGTYGGGVFKSTNSGRSWSKIDSGLTNLKITSITSLSTDLYAGTEGDGIFLSTDDGFTWSSINNNINNEFITSLYTLGTNIFAGTAFGPGGGVYATANRGSSWQYQNSGFENYSSLNTLIISSNKTFAGQDGGICLSSDNGVTWSDVSNGLPTNLTVNTLLSSGSMLFAGTGGNGVYASSNNGTNWNQLNNGFHPNPVIKSLIVNSSVIFAASDSGVYVSSNNGSNWSVYRSGLPSRSRINDLSFLDTLLFAATSADGIYKSLNRGLSWTSTGSLPSVEINNIAVISGIIFISTDGSGVYSSSDKGITWVAKNNGLSDLTVRELYANGSQLIAATSSGVFISVDNANSWTRFFSTGLTNTNLKSIVITGNNLLVGTVGSGEFSFDITSALLTGSLAKTNYCTTNQLQIPVIAIGSFNSGNIFTAELSDSVGSFANPRDIGTLNSTNSGNLTATIPADAPAGIAYKIRVRSSSPDLTSPINDAALSINKLPVVTLQPFNNVCASDPPFTLSGGSPAGGSYSGLGVSNGKFDPSSVGSGNHSITYTYSDSNGCSSSATQPIHVLSLPDVSLDSLPTVCVTNGPVTLTGGSPTGGTYSGPGVSNGIFYPDVAGAGSQTIKYTVIGENGCSNTASRILKVIPKPNVLLTNFKDVCMDTPEFDLSGGIPTGGSYSGDGVIAGKFYPALAGIGSHNITYYYKDAYGCSDSAVKAIHVYPLPEKPTITRGGDELAASSAVTYQWYFKDELITGATMQYYKPDKVGFYKVEITDVFGCKAVSDPFYFSGTGVIDFLSFDNGYVYPNPTDGILTIGLYNTDIYSNVEFTIRDLLGNSIVSGFLRDGVKRTIVDISGYPGGIYFIVINTNQKSYLSKLIKK